MMAKILIIDDEPFILESLDMFLAEKGHDIFKAADGTQGLSLFERHRPTVVILDIRLPDMSGFDVLERLNRKAPAPKVVMMTAFHEMETAIRSMKHGAFDYIYKPLDADQVESAVERAVQVVSVEAEAASGTGSVSKEPPIDGVIIGDSRQMLEIFKTIGVLCQNHATALIEGETGTGKELIARVIHENSPFCGEPFMTMDCAATVETLIESELFGHEKGAFTGAAHCQKGKLELAGSGTLFLDEVGELPMNLQGKFLGFLERLEYIRVGGQVPLQSRCRIIAATNRDLADMTREGFFRKDLYYRLKVVTISVPPLRERRGDIPELAQYFLKKANAELNAGVVNLQPGIVERLMAYHWPGNVRELEKVRCCVSAGEALPPEIFRRWKLRFGIDILDGIGSTEMAHIYISNRHGSVRAGSTGQIVPGYQGRIVDEHFNDVPEGEVGTLLVSGDSAAACYWNKHEKTKETMLGSWLNTGDKFYRDQEGFYFYVGRTNDMLKVGGIWVSPIEVEACIMEHPDVLECAVVGAVDDEELIKPKAFVVLRNGVKADEEMGKNIKQYVKKKLAHYKYPRWVSFVNALPKTATGKIKRFELKTAA